MRKYRDFLPFVANTCEWLYKGFKTKRWTKDFWKIYHSIFSTKLCCPNKIIVKSLVNYSSAQNYHVYYSFQSSILRISYYFARYRLDHSRFDATNFVYFPSRNRNHNYSLSSLHPPVDSKIDHCSISIHNQTFVFCLIFPRHEISNTFLPNSISGKILCKIRGEGSATNLCGAYFVTFPVASAESAAIRWDRIDASSDRKCDAWTAGSGTSTPRWPIAPTTVHDTRLFSDQQAFHSVTPLQSWLSINRALSPFFQLVASRAIYPSIALLHISLSLSLFRYRFLSLHHGNFERIDRNFSSSFLRCDQLCENLLCPVLCLSRGIFQGEGDCFFGTFDFGEGEEERIILRRVIERKETIWNNERGGRKILNILIFKYFNFKDIFFWKCLLILYF